MDMDKQVENKVKCKQCGEEFIKHKKHKLGMFCSHSCGDLYRKWNNEPNCKCPVCGVDFYRKQSQIKKNKTSCCGTECSNKYRKIAFSGKNNHQHGLKGKLNASFKEGEILNSDGYLKVYCGDHPFQDKSGRVYKHRLVAEEYLLNKINKITIDGKEYLDLDHVVHHIDFDKTNNNVDNLVVLSHANHTRIHNQIEYRGGF